MNFGTYAGTALVRRVAQVSFPQLKEVADDAEINAFIQDYLVPQAEQVVNGYTKNSFGTPSYGTMTLDGNGKQVLWFPPKWCPLIGFQAGSVDSVGITIGNIRVYDQHIAYVNSNFPEGYRNVVFYGSYGWLDEHRGAIVPRDVEYVTAALAGNVLADLVRRNQLPDVMREVLLTRSAEGKLGIGSLFASPHLFTSELKGLLDPYKINWIDVG